MPRMTGEVSPYIPAAAPLGYRLSSEVYALDGDTAAPVQPMLASRGLTGSLAKIYSPPVRIAGSLAAAYHGYKRNQSIGWAIGWAFMGGGFPFLTNIIAIAQGFGKSKKK